MVSRGARHAAYADQRTTTWYKGSYKGSTPFYLVVHRVTGEADQSTEYHFEQIWRFRGDQKRFTELDGYSRYFARTLQLWLARQEVKRADSHDGADLNDRI